MTPETGRLGIKKERRDGRGGGGEDRTARRARQMTSFWWQSLKTEESQRTCLRAITKPSGRTPCSHGLNPELITGSLDSKHGVNYQSQMSNDYQREVKNKPACLIRLTSTSLNLHANSQLSMHTFKIKAIVWLALQIILISSELEGNISNPIILQIRKLNKVKTDKVAYPSSQSHFGMKKWFHHDSWYYTMLPTEWERNGPQGMAPGFIGATSGEKRWAELAISALETKPQAAVKLSACHYSQPTPYDSGQSFQHHLWAFSPRPFSLM